MILAPENCATRLTGRLDSLEIPSPCRGRISRGFSFSTRIFSLRASKSWPTRKEEMRAPTQFSVVLLVQRVHRPPGS